MHYVDCDVQFLVCVALRCVVNCAAIARFLVAGVVYCVRREAFSVFVCVCVCGAC